MFQMIQMIQKNEIRPKADHYALTGSEVYKMLQISIPKTLVLRWRLDHFSSRTNR